MTAHTYLSMEQSTSHEGVFPDALSRDRTAMFLFRGPGKMPSYMHKTGRTSPPVHLAFDLLLFLFSRRFCPFCLAQYPFPSFFLMRHTFNMLAIAMLISAAVTLGEYHIVTGTNL